MEYKNDQLFVSSLSSNPADIFNEINNYPFENEQIYTNEISLENRINKENYLSIIKILQQHILRGDCYEINFCQEFFCENAELDPVSIYQKLSKISPSPFAAFYKLNDRYLICASPERFIKKIENTIIAQPIKGTIKRNIDNEIKDDFLKKELQNSEKDKRENVMIVDLMRNDLSKICKQGSIVVDELFGIYSFPQVHQMISTIKGELAESIDFADVLEATFPMGSMTGAPKKVSNGSDRQI